MLTNWGWSAFWEKECLIQGRHLQLQLSDDKKSGWIQAFELSVEAIQWEKNNKWTCDAKTEKDLVVFYSAQSDLFIWIYIVQAFQKASISQGLNFKGEF